MPLHFLALFLYKIILQKKLTHTKSEMLLHVILVAFSVGVLTVLLIVLICRWCCFQQPKNLVDTNQRRPDSFQIGIQHLHQLNGPSQHNHLANYYVFRRGGVSAKPLFNWSDHPELVLDAVENGWSRFGFTSYMSSPSTRSSLLGICAVGDYHGRETKTDISWEVCPGSADFMQKIRLNLGLKKVNTSSSPSMSAASVITTALPLPGPHLGNSAFPQEAYFEIKILYARDDDQSFGNAREGERSKLIRENSNANANSESLVHVTSGNRINKIDESKLAGSKGDVVMLSLGLTPGGSLPSILPGSYPGSIGFNSDGSVYLDGTKLVFESEKAEWGRTENVIGCGYDPRKKKVFLTVDSELVHVISCKSEEFETPLYPTIAANMEVLVLVNFGQSAFTYSPANAQRTSNPCFIDPLVNHPAAALGYEDSKELFSMGRIDSQWLNRSATKGGHNAGTNTRTGEFDEESEADLFEIALESTGQSPNTVL